MFRRVRDILRDPQVLDRIVGTFMKSSPEVLVSILRRRKVLKFIYASVLIEFLNAEGFYKDFFKELGNANREVIIYSPFVHSNRLLKLGVLNALRRCVLRGVSVNVYIRRRDDRSIFNRSDYEHCIKEMKQAGIKVHELAEFHAKIVAIDRRITYVGGINVLSHKEGSPDCMLKIKDPDLTDVLLSKIYEHLP